MYPTKIYINGKFLAQQKSGVQSYALGLIKSMIKYSIDFEILVPKSISPPEIFKFRQIGVFLNLNLWEQISLPLFVNKKKGAILINLCNSAPLFTYNQIVTIHDLAFEIKHVQWFNNLFKLWYRFLIPKICKSAKCILTVSEFSKNEIMSYYKIKSDKIFITYNGFDFPDKISKKQISQDYLLLLGGNNPRKNISAILKQIDVISQKGLKLVVVETGNSIYNSNKLFKHPNIIYFNHVCDEDYYSLLKYSKAVLYPSLYEGFGIPILECLCLKTPVICNSLEVFKESFGDLPIYFDVNTKLEFIKALDSVSTFSINDDAIKELRTKYSFNESVSVILKFLEST